ncbi:hypothetical protein SRIMM317S_03252 [Streptomyces rimosus subsp. rimosus]
MPGAGDQPDVGNTADAVVALAAGSHGDAAQKPLKWLEKNSANWAKEAGPAAYAQLVLAAHAAGGGPRHFGGADLVAQLNATGPSRPAAPRRPPPPRRTRRTRTSRAPACGGSSASSSSRASASGS